MSKNLVLDDYLTSNMVNGPKNCWNLSQSFFTMFIQHYERNSVGKILSE